MVMQQHFYEQLDVIAANTWPAETCSTLGQWQLRASRGVTKRANSVLAIGGYPPEPDWLQRVEQFYHNQDLPAIFHISPASPATLDAYLQEQGYVIDTPCLIMTAESQTVLQFAEERLKSQYVDASDLQIDISPVATAAWLEAFLRLEQFPDTRMSFYRGLSERMPAPKAFITLLEHGQVVALGTALVEGDWAGFVNVIVDEAYRGKGYGYAILHALTAWSMVNGATQQYLQVITSNVPAVTLYEKLSYRSVYGYHYRVKYDIPSLVSS
ncbi:GNAT family N-acetyltransferase [Paenibacillus roseipurpureus]|uniref:GNAT family N-acetyltransferase n=1 Tax=Paenibacillus roseopurpureus TaxID=2918901 RepID=A0AA96RI17_9BACL|nr:GNAT family N-acetyltransferase [Paenibacillus sp. MBLB1832]WNR42290.1 GNAT family N-acetyltransferase [Paenibacillus sp. MBLB1832]